MNNYTKWSRSEFSAYLSSLTFNLNTIWNEMYIQCHLNIVSNWGKWISRLITRHKNASAIKSKLLVDHFNLKFIHRIVVKYTYLKYDTMLFHPQHDTFQHCGLFTLLHFCRHPLRIQICNRRQWSHNFITIFKFMTCTGFKLQTTY